MALSSDHILPPGAVTFTCPEGHFWFRQLDRKICPPPIKPDQEWLCDFAHAPCPTTREEALSLLWVLERIGPDDYHWRGYTMSDPEALADLTPGDRAAWDAWIAQPQVGAFLDDLITRCRSQAEANRSNPGFMVFGSRPPVDPNGESL